MKPIIFLYGFTVVSILIYSYTQVDLNLTLFTFSVYQHIQNLLLKIGYFHRPLSTLIYLAIVTSLTICYIWLIYQQKSASPKNSKYIKLLLFITLILLFAYPAFSYDIFNYIFDARIFVLHKSNPWTLTALDFPDDLWTRFMRWTHRTYPYGPTWLPLTIPFYAIGLHKFTLTLVSFKLLGLVSYLAATFSIYQIAKTIKLHNPWLSVILFAFNPLIIIESIVSPHLDITMAALMVLGIWLILSHSKTFGFISLVISAGIKYVSIGIFPAVLLYLTKKISFSQMIELGVLLTYMLTLLVISQREILPWYLITPFALTVLIPKNKIAISLMLSLTPAALLRYAPFIYIGDYTPWVSQARNLITGILVVSLLTIFFLLHKSLFKHK